MINSDKNLKIFLNRFIPTKDLRQKIKISEFLNFFKKHIIVRNLKFKALRYNQEKRICRN